MNKRLFILMFLIMTSPVMAEEAYIDEVVDETRPSLEEVQTSVDVKPTISQKVKNTFNFSKIKKGKEAEVVEPKQPKGNKLKSFLKRDKKDNLISYEPANSDDIRPEIFATTNEEQQATEEQPVSNVVTEETKDTPQLNDNAYQAAIDTTEIISVDQCVELALKNHPAIHMAMSNAEIYKSRIAQAWANYFPTFSAGLSYSRNDMMVTTVAPPTQRYDLFYVPTLSANMLLFDFGKTKSMADIAKKTYESAEYTLQSSINDVIYNCKSAYYNLLFALQQEQVYEETVKDFELHLEQAWAYYNIGTKPKIDVLTAQYNLGNAKLNLIKAQNTVKIAYVQLSNAMGLPDYTDYQVKDNLNTKSYDINVDEAVNTAYETRPELLASKKKADASELLVRASKRAFTPDLSGFASYSRGGKKIDTDEGYQIGAQLTYSAVNLLSLKKQVDEAKATYQRDLADYQNTKQKVYFDVKEAYINLVNAQDSIGVAKLSMDQAKEQYDLAEGRYKVGVASPIELKEAQNTYAESQLAYYEALYQYNSAKAELEKAIGKNISNNN